MMVIVYLIGGILALALLLYFFGPKEDNDANQNQDK